MSKILVPVPVEKRLPDISEESEGLFSYKTGLVPDIYTGFAFIDKNGEWHDAQGFEHDKETHYKPYGKSQVIAWYEEIEIESLFPDDHTAGLVAANASNKSFTKMLSHQEGQTYIQNYIIKKLNS